jgi:hypothetical protein
MTAYEPPPPPDISVQAAALREAFPTHKFTVTGDSIEVTRCDGGTDPWWCFITADAKKIWRELSQNGGR